MRPRGDGEREVWRRLSEELRGNGDRCSFGSRAPFVKGSSDPDAGILGLLLLLLAVLRRRWELDETPDAFLTGDEVPAREDRFSDLAVDLARCSSLPSSGVVPSRWRLAVERVTGPEYSFRDSDASEGDRLGDVIRGVEGASC